MKVLSKISIKYKNMPIAAKATIWFIVCSIVQKSISLLTTPIFTRIMSTAQYGQFSVYNSWLQVFTIITTLRLNLAVFNKGMSKYKLDRDGYTSTMQTLTCLITTLVLAFYLMFRRQMNSFIELPTYVVLAMFAELYVTPAIDFWTTRKRYEYAYKPVVFRTLLMAFLNAGIGVFAVLVTEEKGIARIFSCIVVNISVGFTLFVYNLRKGKRLFNLEYAKFALSFNLPLLLHYLSQYVLDQFDRIMIQKMVGIAATGVYSVAYNVGLMLKIITQSVNSALTPWQYEKLEKRDFKELDDTIFLIFLGIASVTILFSAFAPEVMKILASERYFEAVYAIPPVALSMFFSFVYMTFANVEFYYDQNKFTMYVSMICASLNVILNYVGIKTYGYLAAAYTTLICYILFAILHYIYMSYCVKKKLHQKVLFNTKRLVILCSTVLIAGLLVIILYDKIIVRYTFIIISMGVMFWKRYRILEIVSTVKQK